MDKLILPKTRLFLLAGILFLLGVFGFLQPSQAQSESLKLQTAVSPVLWVFLDENMEPVAKSNVPEQKFTLKKEKNSQEINLTVLAEL